MVATYSWFWLVVWLFEIALRVSSQGLSSFPKCRKAVVCLLETVPVLGKLRSGISESAADHEFKSVKQIDVPVKYRLVSQIYIYAHTPIEEGIFQPNPVRLYTDQLMKIVGPEAHRNSTLYLPSGQQASTCYFRVLVTFWNITTMNNEHQLGSYSY